MFSIYFFFGEIGFEKLFLIPPSYVLVTNPDSHSFSLYYELLLTSVKIYASENKQVFSNCVLRMQHAYLIRKYICIHLCMYVYMYVRMYVFIMYTYIYYIYIYLFICICNIL